MPGLRANSSTKNFIRAQHPICKMISSEELIVSGETANRTPDLFYAKEALYH